MLAPVSDNVTPGPETKGKQCQQGKTICDVSCEKMLRPNLHILCSVPFKVMTGNCIETKKERELSIDLNYDPGSSLLSFLFL